MKKTLLTAALTATRCIARVFGLPALGMNRWVSATTPPSPGAQR